MNVPIYVIEEDEVDASYQAFAALRKAAQVDPSLIENKYFVALQDTAFARFLLNFEALQ